jgi:hypothetical protein
MNPEDKALEFKRRKSYFAKQSRYLQNLIMDANEQEVKTGRKTFARVEIYVEMLDLIGEIEYLTGKPWAEALSE